ncbi:MAG TPA: hypothetical protein VMP01_13240 [Pirellulaceae bacterium]|nr:hypothetical protein [Pirellulaceae bacterium]
MSLRFASTLLVIAAAALCGCRTSPHVASFIENRNAEARQLEDEYWYQVQENERLAHELGKLKQQRATEPTRSGDEVGPPMIEEGGLPMIEVPGTPAERSSPRIEAEPPPEMPSELPPPRANGQAKRASAEVELVDEKIAQLFVNPLHTGGIDRDHRPGDDGLSLLLEPRNAAGQFVPQEGNVSIVLLDPAKSGDAARVARWNFDAAETKEAIRDDGDARGIHLEMPWPSRAPENSQLKLFVRYEGADGRKFQAEREVFIKLAREYSERWTPRPPQRQRRNPPVATAAAAEPTIREPAAAATPNTAPPSAPPPALSDASGKSAPRPTWKPYR